MMAPLAQRPTGALVESAADGAGGHQTFDTGARPAHFGACPLPEQANAFTRGEIDFRSVSWYLTDGQCGGASHGGWLLPVSALCCVTVGTDCSATSIPACWTYQWISRWFAPSSADMSRCWRSMGSSSGWNRCPTSD